jgi:superfamily II RNA helicase
MREREAAVVLWASGLFDTAEIAGLVRLPEGEVEQVTRTARELTRGMPPSARVENAGLCALAASFADRRPRA